MSSNFMILDGMSLVYPFSAKIQDLPIRIQRGAIRDWVSYFSRPWLYLSVNNPVGLDPYDCLPVLTMDLKYPKDHPSLPDKYWRHGYHKGYKSGRREKTPGLITTRQLIVEAWNSFGLPYLSQPGFEADDFAGAWVRTMEPGEKVGLVSIDGDWSQLVSDRVIWLDVFPPSRRSGPTQKESVLGFYEVLTRFNNQKEFQSCTLTQPHDIVDHKHRLGDKSDGIPKGRAVPIGIIDLKSPLESPDLDRVMQVRKFGQVCLGQLPLSESSHYDFGVPDWKASGGNSYG